MCNADVSGKLIWKGEPDISCSLEVTLCDTLQDDTPEDVFEVVHRKDILPLENPNNCMNCSSIKFQTTLHCGNDDPRQVQLDHWAKDELATNIIDFSETDLNHEDDSAEQLARSISSDEVSIESNQFVGNHNFDTAM